MARIVVIEDDDEVSKMIAHHFKKRLGSDVVTFGQAKLALDHLLEVRDPPALILVDLGLPDLSGFEFISRVRQGGLSGVPIVVITARAGLQERARALDVGADDFVEKPFSLKALEQKVKKFLEA